MATKKARAKRKSPAAKKTAARKRVTKKSAPRKVARKKPAARKSARKRPVARKTSRRVSRKTAAGKPAATAKRAAAKPAPSRKKTASAKRTANPRRASASPKLDASLFPVGDDALRGATGRSWQEWLGLLDKAGAGAGSLDHQQIHDLAMQWVPGADRWWGQMVSTGYERARGLHEKAQARAGRFKASISKTLPVPLFAAFAAWADQSLRRGWLDAADLDFTRLNAGRNIRARWPDGSVLDIRFDSTSPDQCEIVVDATKLADAGAAERAKAFWQEQFERLQAYLRI